MGERRVTADGRVLERQADGSIQVVGTVGGVASNPIKVREATTGIDNTAAQAQGRQIDNRVASATVVPQIRQVGAEAAKTEAQATTAQQGTRMNGLGDKQYSDALGQYNAALQIQRQRADLRKTYNNGPGATKGLAGLADFMPGFMNEGNQRFDTAANRMRAFAKSGTGTTGGENNTAAEMKLNLGSYIPSASNWDSTTEDNFGAIGDLGDKGFHEAIQRLGGVPDAMGNIHPIDSPEGKQLIGEYQALAALGNAQQSDQAAPIMGGGGFNSGGGQGSGPMPGQMTMGDYADKTPGGPVGAASGTLRGPEYRQEYDTEYQKQADALFRSGASYEQMNQFSLQNGYGGFNAAQYTVSRRAFDGWKKSHGGREYNGYMVVAPLKPVKQTGWERAAQGIPGAVGIGLGNAGSFGALDALAPDKMAMARTAHPYAEGAGEIGGAFTGTGILGRLGGQAGAGLSKIAPGAVQRATQALANSPTARNLALDTGYGVVRGGVSNPDDPLGGMLEGGAMAGLGSGAGNAVGGAMGRGLSGVRSSPTISRLRAQGVTPSLGQIMRGRAFDNGGKSIVASLEDTVANTPGVSTFVNTTRNRALEQGNNAAYRAAGDGAPINGVGEQALGQLHGVKNQAYSDALSGVSLPAQEPRFIQQVNAADNGGRQIDALRGKGDFAYVMDHELAPLVMGGQQINGQQMQDAFRVLQSRQRAFGQAANGVMPDPAAGGVANALGDVENAFTGLTARNAPGAIPKLKNANRINRGLSVLEDAASRGMNEGGVFTGPQLGAAIKSNGGKFGQRGLTNASKSPLYQLQQDMTNALPNKVPPTGVNAAPMLAAAGLLSGGTNEATGFDSNTVRALSLAALLSTPYTRTGSAAVAKALLDRPAALQKIGSAVRKKKGLLGTMAVPMMLESQR